MDVVSDTPPSFQNNHSEYLRYLASRYDANIFVLDLGGFVVFPHIPDFIAGESIEPDDYSAQLEELKIQLKENGQDGYVIYESENAYVYGAQITLFASGENAHYIYVEKSLEFIQNAFQKIVVRMVGVAVILSILALAISSALAAWMGTINRMMQTRNARMRRMASPPKIRMISDYTTVFGRLQWDKP